MHVAWNVAEGPLLGFPLSGFDFPSAMSTSVHGPAFWTGGKFGPEAGFLGVLANLAGIGALLAWQRGSEVPRRHGDTEGHGGTEQVESGDRDPVVPSP